MATVKHLLDVLLGWAPAALAWEKDNIGLLTGHPSDECTGALVALDVTPEIVAEAVARNANVIVAHHPVIYRPVSTIRDDYPQGQLLASILRNRIAVIAMHTNADSTSGGVNALLAEALGLRGARPLDPYMGGDAAGLDAAELGMGMVGELDETMDAAAFFGHVKRALGCTALRVSAHEEGRVVRRVAVCGGAGSSLIGAAVASGADAFVTGDLSYHAFQDHRSMLLLVDAGHFETEFPFVERCVAVLRGGLFEEKEKSRIFPAVSTTNAMWTK